METLTAFVRERARWEPSSSTAETIARDEAGRGRSLFEKRKLPTDIAAVLTVIRRREKMRHEVQKWLTTRWRLDLSATDLRGADLEGVHLDTSISRTLISKALCFPAHISTAQVFNTRILKVPFLTAPMSNMVTFMQLILPIQYFHMRISTMPSSYPQT